MHSFDWLAGTRATWRLTSRVTFSYFLSSAAPIDRLSCLPLDKNQVCGYVVVTCEIKFFWNNFEIISVFISYVSTVDGYMIMKWNAEIIS